MARTDGSFGHGPEMLREHWLYNFVGKEEKEQLLIWLAQEGLTRPEAFDDRIAHAEYLRNLGNDWYQKTDYRRALHCSLGAVHCLDYPPLWQQSQSEDQRRKLAESMLPVVSNLTMIFLKRGDFESADAAATSGLLCAKKLPAEDTTTFRGKLYYRRALARAETGPQRDYDASHADLVEAAQLDPSNTEIRRCLKNCKELRQGERREAFQKGPRYEPISKPKDNGEKQQGSVDQAEDVCGESSHASGELSPALELFAACVGKCLGRTRRWCRCARQRCKQVTATGANFGRKYLWIVQPLIFCLALGSVAHGYFAAAEYSFFSRMAFSVGALLIAVFVFNLLLGEIVGKWKENDKDE